MNQDILLLRKALREGRCCSTALVSLAMQKKGMDHGEAAEAVSVLCRGLHAGMTCGALTGGALALGILAPGAEADEMASDLAAWFKEFCGDSYGGTDCTAILDGDPDNEMLRCPQIVESVWIRIRELLEDEGLDPDRMKE